MRNGHGMQLSRLRRLLLLLLLFLLLLGWQRGEGLILSVIRR